MKMRNTHFKMIRYFCLFFVIVFGLMAIIGSNGGGGGGDNGNGGTTTNTDPTATISNPSNGSTYTEGSTITFSGTGNDAEDGALTGSSLVWTSNVDGYFTLFHVPSDTVVYRLRPRQLID